ncbi:outer membrane protein assembly factor BamE [Rhizobium oryzicola]|uniref:Outer membrane protein assembly factor BamE n=1 Tax=Rhizobium oryzicola TaxID=1232668 RepID=A0ABT8STM1_9HYPH|nr:outer membrane protein assembly factor BamE [Rhizobium oryzicola]MDO1581775.1 outer membrane protein assembly factor BamE [Rhizobium oryzicola]
MKTRVFGSELNLASKAAVALVVGCLGLTGCTSMGQTIYNGYVLDKDSLDLIPEGSSREQVLLSMGTPSTTATFDGEVFYYISQKRQRPVAFMKPKLVEQTIVAVYFNKEGVVTRRAQYTLQDGKVFDMVTRTTPTGGRDLTFLQQLLSGGTGANSGGAATMRSMLGGNGNKGF